MSMMPGNGAFWLFAALAIPLNALPARPERRVAMLAVTNVAFAYAASPPAQFAVFCGFLFVSWCLLKLAGNAGPMRRRSIGFRTLLVAPAVTFFALHKGHDAWATQLAGAPSPLQTALHALTFVGAAYVVMRYLHVAIDICEEDLSPPTLNEYVAYAVPWFMAAAGPIQRIQAFRAAQAVPLVVDRLTFVKGLERICRGLFKAFALTDLLSRLGPLVPAVGWSHWVIAADLFLAYLYLDFSGYTDIAVGIGQLIGWPTPENFANPFAARNLVDLWQRWHITLSTWTRDYVFTPLSRALLQRRRWSPLILAALAYTGSMAVLGLWHGISGAFLLYGLLQAFGSWCCKAWETLLKKRFGAAGLRRYRASVPVRVVATVINLQFFAFTLLLMYREVGHGMFGAAP